MTSGKNVADIVSLLTKEIVKIVEECSSKEYSLLLVQAIHSSSIKYPELAYEAALLVSGLLASVNSLTAAEIIAFVREVLERYPKSRVKIVELLVSQLKDTKYSRTLRGNLWIIGEYCENEQSNEINYN
jgi:coatomer subunit beta